jgi:hypothetical protein
MTCFVSQTAIDCHDAFAQAEWWKRLLGYVDLEDDPNAPDHTECEIRDPETDHRLLFIQVPEDKVVKNRLHLDLRPRERSRDEEIEWVRSLGATEVADHRGIDGPGSGWVVFTDPEGNEFCVLRSRAELAAMGE